MTQAQSHTNEYPWRWKHIKNRHTSCDLQPFSESTCCSLPRDFKLSKRSPQFCQWLQGAFKNGNACDGSKSVHGFETLWQFLPWIAAFFSCILRDSYYHASQKQQTETWFPKDHPRMNRYDLWIESHASEIHWHVNELLRKYYFKGLFFCCESHPNSLERKVKTELLVSQVQESVWY